MADQNKINSTKRDLRGSWQSSTERIRRRTEEETKRLAPAAGRPLTEDKIQQIVNSAVSIEAEERAEAITAVVVVQLLNIIESLEGRIEDLEQRLERLGSVGPTGTTTTL